MIFHKVEPIRTYTFERLSRLFAVVAFILLLFGAKLWLIDHYGNPTPFWDQWDGEAANLYAPFLEGTLRFQDLFAAHNEHRIFTTRLLSLAELKTNGVWNPLLQMVINAVLHITVLLFIIIQMLKVIGQKYLLPVLAFSLILFSTPYAYENTLAGFQAQFYFVLFFSISTLWLTITKPPFSKNWWIGLISGGFAYFSLASGVFAIAAAAGVGIIVFLLKLRRDSSQLFAILMFMIIFTVGVCYTPLVPNHVLLKAHSPEQFFRALFTILSWPLDQFGTYALFINAPAIIFISYMLWRRPPSEDTKWFLFGTVMWAAIQSASIAYGRHEGPLAPRYLDLYAILILINFICLLSFLKIIKPAHRRLGIISVAIWAIIILLALINTRAPSLHGAAFLYQKGLEQQINTSRYIATGDMDNLRNKPLFSIPYPDADRLAMILNKASIRSILPSDIASLKTKKLGRLDDFVSALLSHYWVFLWAGFMSLLLTLFFILLRRDKRSSL
ncbi:hypothetical protein [Aquirhabdus sp.]|uniref:hypothetical protein n=1 Tax=Aquirhabdus sp. TaxID=2824160 RepID=UPI00396C7521